MGNYRTFGTALDRVFRNDLNNNFSDIANDINAQKTRVDNLITGTPQPSEVVDARGGKAVLKDRLDAVDASLAESTQQTFNQTKRVAAPYKYDGAIFTFCDDDCQTPFMTKMKPIFDGKGVKATLGVITGNVGTSDAYNSFMTLDQLKSLQSEGYDIVCHSKTHDAAIYKASTTDLSTVPSSTIEADLRDAWQYCIDNGFGYETLIFPYGGFTPNTQTLRYKSIARKYFKYALNAFGNHNDTPVDNMYMNRYALDMTQNFTTVLKPIIDACISKKGWLIFYTHSQENKVDATYMNTVIDYIKSQNALILTFSEGVKYKGNAIAAGEYTDAQNKFYLSNDGNHITGSRLVAETYDNTIDMTRTPSQFKIGVTITSIAGGKDTVTGQGGDLISYIPPATDGAPAGNFCYQTFTPYNKNDLYMRKWLQATSVWGSWTKISSYYSPVYDSTVLMDNPVTAYSTGTTLTAIAGPKDTLTSLGGDLVTHVPPASDGTAAQDFCYQLFTPYNANRLYMRKWLKASSTWGSWEQIGYKNVVTSNTKVMDDPITIYPVDTETSYAIWNTNDTLLSVGGVMKVTRFSNDDFSYATYTPYNANSLYMRKWLKASSAWGTWQKISAI